MNEQIKEIATALKGNPALYELMKIALEFKDDKDALETTKQCLKGTEKVQ